MYLICSFVANVFKVDSLNNNFGIYASGFLNRFIPMKNPVTSPTTFAQYTWCVRNMSVPEQADYIPPQSNLMLFISILRHCTNYVLNFFRTIILSYQLSNRDHIANISSLVPYCFPYDMSNLQLGQYLD
jgi:hypothetical protein